MTYPGEAKPGSSEDPAARRERRAVGVYAAASILYQLLEEHDPRQDAPSAPLRAMAAGAVEEMEAWGPAEEGIVGRARDLRVFLAPNPGETPMEQS